MIRLGAWAAALWLASAGIEASIADQAEGRLPLLPEEATDGQCLATGWLADPSRVGDLVTNLRRQGYIASAEYGVYRIQIGYRVVDPKRLLFHEAAQRIEKVSGLDLGSAAVGRGADGRSTVMYGYYERLPDADQRAWELRRRRVAAEVEPLYRTWPTARAVFMAPLGRASVASFGDLWHRVDCDALAW